MRVISMRDVIGAARGFMESGVDGLSFSDNWDTMPLADLDEALEGAGIGADRDTPSSRVSVIPVPVSVANEVKRRSNLLSKGQRG